MSEQFGKKKNTKHDQEPEHVMQQSVSQDDYRMLLTRVVKLINEKDPENSIGTSCEKLVISPPQVFPVGTKKTSVPNFGIICEKINRDKAHVGRFDLGELGTTGSVTQNCLLIKGKFGHKQIQSVLRR